MNKIYAIVLMFAGLFSVLLTGCDDTIEPPINDLQLDRVLTPHGLRAFIRNQTTIELTWNFRNDADYYVVEFSEDSLQFNTIIFTIEVTKSELPYRRTFDGETRYSARVKGVSNGVADSQWSAITIMTAQENIFLPIQDGDIQATEATLRWPENSDVTHLIINPGNVQRTITADEKSAGVATIIGLTGQTNYTVVLYRDDKHRGLVSFNTLIDVGDAILIYPEDDLNEAVINAAPGDVLVLYPGDYLVYTGTIVIDKSITIQGLYPYDKPVVHVKFEITGGVLNFEITDVELNGDGTHNDVFRFTQATDYGTLKISGCEIHDFSRSLLAGNVNGLVSSVIIDNVVATNILTSGGDFIDFRNTHVLDLKVTNSTFNNCSPARDFIRMDNSGDAGHINGTYLATVLVEHCTILGASHPSSRLLYVRFNDHDVTFSKNIVANTTGYFINHGGQNGSTIRTPNYNGNNYYEAPHLYQVPEGGAPSGNFRYDQSGTHTTLNPGFVNPANGNFTVTNQTLLDNEVGDPRWR
jgi:hypothetical protein